MKKLEKIIGLTIYIWMGIQIALGVIWGICNMNKLPVFEESRELLAMSQNLVADDYTGYLYLLLLRGCTMVADLLGVSVGLFLYPVQLLIAYLCYEYFLHKVVFREQGQRLQARKRMPFYVGFILTIPMVLQVHMAVLPYSLASSLLVALMAKMISLCVSETGEKKADAIQVAVLWILGALICPDYGWLCGFGVAGGVIWYVLAHKHLCGRLLLGALVAILCIVGSNAFLQTPGSNGKMQKFPESVLLRSVVWPSFVELSFFWPQEVRDNWTTEELMILSMSPERVSEEFGPVMEQKLGVEEARRVYREMIKQTIKMNTRDVITGMGQEAAAYLCPPVSVKVQLQGVGDSYTGWNYGRMKDYAPQVTKYYVECALSAWIYLLVATGFLCICRIRPGQWQPKGKKVRLYGTLVYAGSMILVVDVWYVLVSGNMQDYLKVPMITALWAMGIIGVLRRSEGA
ncbi:MAG: hypothetical protein IKL22_12410 [Lachnospiraceae bacterium]|nr:hypothetical protein [Lachnospiraceae bacterium]